MALGQVIDLLSSEDEAPLRAQNSVKPIAETTAPKENFFYLSDEIDSTIHFNDAWPDCAPKRRKLSPPHDEEDIVPPLPTLTLSSKPITASQNTLKSKAQDKHGWNANEGSDPIIFTSSAHAETTISRTKRRATDALSAHIDESDDSLPDDLLSATVRSTTAGSALSERTMALLATLSQSSAQQKPSNTRKSSSDKVVRAKDRAKSSVDIRSASESEDGEGNQRKPAKTSRKPKLTDEEKAAKVREKESTKEARKKQKEKEKEKKRLEKEEKAKEKRIAAELAEVNKSKLDKKDSTPEMIVHLPASINGQSVDTQIREFLKNLGVDATLYQSPIPNVIRWRRKVKARWNPELDYWEPLEYMQIENERHVLCIMSAKEFVALATAQNEEQDVETHVAKLKSAYENCIPIYLIEGLQSWMRKNRTAENRAYQAKVLSQAQADETSAGNQPKRRKAPVEIVDEDTIEDALLRLQVMNGCLVHHTMTTVETAEWVANFTQHISTIPYRYFSLPGLSPFSRSPSSLVNNTRTHH